MLVPEQPGLFYQPLLLKLYFDAVTLFKSLPYIVLLWLGQALARWRNLAISTVQRVTFGFFFLPL